MMDTLKTIIIAISKAIIVKITVAITKPIIENVSPKIAILFSKPASVDFLIAFVERISPTIALAKPITVVHA